MNNIDKKELIIIKLEELIELYKEKENKKWNIIAILKVIDSLKKYEGIITSGEQLKKDIKGIGEKISKRIDEILETDNLKELNNSLNNVNNLNNILDITGVGLIRGKKWIEMDIKNIEDVKNAILEKKIISTHHIDIGIKYYNDFKEKISRLEIDKIKDIFSNILKKIDKKLVFEICGSYRRNKDYSGDIDILVSHPKYIDNINDKNFLEKIIKESKNDNFIIDNLTEKGNTKFMGVCKIDYSKYARRIDIRVVNYKSYFTSLLYFTGNKNFNLYIRNVALQKNYSLNEYCLTDIRDNSIIFIKSEKEIFKILNIEYKTPIERDLF
jgi:DNA polymerase/3'-5' exonuclease PolX